MPKNSSRDLRRRCRKKAAARRRKIIELPNYRHRYRGAGSYRYTEHYDPESGKFDYYITDKKYILYRKNSKGEQYLKNLSARRVRRLPLSEVHGKGNMYRRYFDYQWAMD